MTIKSVIHKPACNFLVSGNSFLKLMQCLGSKHSNKVIIFLNAPQKPQPVHRLDFATTGQFYGRKDEWKYSRLLKKCLEDKKNIVFFEKKHNMHYYW